MKRTSAVIGESLENIGYGFIGAAMLASTALAFIGSPLAPSLARSAGIVGVQLEGLVVTPSRTYSAAEWARRPASARQVASTAPKAKPRSCDLPKAQKPATQIC